MSTVNSRARAARAVKKAHESGKTILGDLLQPGQFRRCKRCQQMLPLEDFGPGHGAPPVNCKACRAYKNKKQHAYNDAKIAAKIASGKKACPGPLCNGTIKSFDEFTPDPRKRIGVSSHCRACMNFARSQRYAGDVERERERSRESTRIIRDKAIQVYGGQCERCGSTHDLEFDHVNGDGGEHRKIEDASSMKRRIATTGRRLEDWELRLLCRDCHRGQEASWTRQSLRLKIASANNWPVIL